MQPQRPRRPHRRRGGPQVQPDRAARHAEPQRARSGPQIAEVVKSGKLGKLLVSRGLCYKPRGSIGIKPNADAAGRGRFRPLARAGRRAAVPRQPGPLQLALVLGFRQRRHRQPGRPRDGHGPLGDPRRHAADAASSASAAASATTTRARRPTRRSPSWTTATRSSSSRSAACKTDALPRPEGRQHRPPRGGHRSPAASSIPKGKRQGRAAARTVDVEPARAGQGDHFGNFIAAVRSRKAEDLNADILEGHYSAALCHLANISYRLGTGALQAEEEASATTRTPTRRSPAWRSTSRTTG